MTKTVLVDSKHKVVSLIKETETVNRRLEKNIVNSQHRVRFYIGTVYLLLLLSCRTEQFFTSFDFWTLVQSF